VMTRETKKQLYFPFYSLWSRKLPPQKARPPLLSVTDSDMSALRTDIKLPTRHAGSLSFFLGKWFVLLPGKMALLFRRSDPFLTH